MKTLVAFLVAAAAFSGTACSSGGKVRSGAPATTAASASTSVSTVPGSTAALQATVPDCGAGAYRPATLLITCATGGVMATGVQWSSWGASTASGTGTVHMTVGGQAASGQADLALSDVVTGSSGPQFTVLTVTWTGRSPDGHPTDTYRLGS